MIIIYNNSLIGNRHFADYTVPKVEVMRN